jgi:fucose permease
MTRQNLTAIKALTFVVFMMFAMTTDSVGIIIPQIIKTFHLSLTAAGSFQYATMGGIGLAGFLLGHLADRIGRKRTIVVGLTLFAAASCLIIAGNSFWYFCMLMALSGAAIGIFKTAALALVGDIVASTKEHTSIMNMVEGFFGVGSIIGPAILTRLLIRGLSWRWLYVLAGTMCVLLIVIAASVRYPAAKSAEARRSNTTAVITNRYILVFSCGAFLYVAVESAVYVWMPTLIADYHGRAAWLAAYSISIFFLLRATGRFLGSWMLNRFQWTAVLALFSALILACFVASVAGGVFWAIFLLPLSGLFMSVIYPTINSKGISCLPKTEHGSGAGVILFFTCFSAVVAPLAMGTISDAMGGPGYGFVLATGFAAVLFIGLTLNWIFNPTLRVFRQVDETEYNFAVNQRSSK